MFTAIKKFIKEKTAAIKNMAVPACIISAIACTTPLAMAAPTAEGLIANIVGVIFTIAGYIGILLFVWGVIMLVLAIRNEDGDSKSRAVLFIIVAIVLITLGAVFDPVMKYLGYSQV